MKYLRSILVVLTVLVLGNAVWAHNKTLQVTLICDVQKAKDAGNYDWVHPAYADAEQTPTKCTNGRKLSMRFFQINF